MGIFKINERLKIVEDEYNDICYVINSNDALELKLRSLKLSYFCGNECKVVGIITLNNFNNWYIVRCELPHKNPLKRKTTHKYYIFHGKGCHFFRGQILYMINAYLCCKTQCLQAF